MCDPILVTLSENYNRIIVNQVVKMWSHPAVACEQAFSRAIFPQTESLFTG